MRQERDNAARRLERIRILCTETDGGRGIWKRIDENRQLLELLQAKAPELLERCPFIEGWLGNTDVFFINLQRLMGLEDAPEWGGGIFPREWRGDSWVGKAYLQFSPRVARMMALPAPAQPGKPSALRRWITRIFKKGDSVE